MPIYLDISAAVHSKAGLGRYAASLGEALAARYPERIALFYNRDAGLMPPASLSRLPARSVRAGYRPWRMAVWLGQLAGVGFDRLLPDAQLYHATEHLLMPLRNTPTVLTVHDLIYRLFPQHHKRLNYWFLNAAMPLFARRASAIIAISQATKRDLVAAYNVPEDKVTVIYEAAAAHFQPPTAEQIDHVRQKYHLPERYMLHVGTIEPRKNLSRLLTALEQLHIQGHNLALVIVGSKGWLYDDFFRQLESSSARDAVVLLGYVVDEDLPAIYGAAMLTVIASVYEGFGLPILEGMACGSAVVSSHASSLPELGGEAARYFDPYSVEGMAEAIRQVLTNRELREAMRRSGFAQAARFSWARAAEGTMQLYKQCCCKVGRAELSP